MKSNLCDHNQSQRSRYVALVFFSSSVFTLFFSPLSPLRLYFPLCSFFALNSNDSSLSPVLSLLPLSFIPSFPLHSFTLQSFLHVFHLSFSLFLLVCYLLHFCLTVTVSFFSASHISSLISALFSFPHPPSFSPITSSLLLSSLSPCAKLRPFFHPLPPVLDPPPHLPLIGCTPFIRLLIANFYQITLIAVWCPFSSSCHHLRLFS